MADAAKWTKFPASIRDAFEGVWQDVASIHFKWNLYLDLFGKPENIEVLNQTTPTVFHLIEESLRADMTMAFGRLLDPAEQGSNKNLSLQHLVQELRPHVDEAHFSKLEKQVQEIKAQCSGILKLRMKKYGHNDLRTALQYHENPLPSVKRSTVEKALALIGGFMNGLQQHFKEGTTVFTKGITRGTGEQLIGLLKRFLQYREQEKRKPLGR
jgi:hypothetical protein